MLNSCSDVKMGINTGAVIEERCRKSKQEPVRRTLHGRADYFQTSFSLPQKNTRTFDRKRTCVSVQMSLYFGSNVLVFWFKRLYVLLQTSLCSDLNVLAFRFKRTGVFKASTHPVTIVLVMEGAIHFQPAVGMQQGDGRMLDTVEHICLDHRIMNHVFKYDSLSYLQFVVKLPAAHIIATQATVSSQPVDMLFPSCCFHRLSRK